MTNEIKQLDLHPDETSLGKLRNTNNENYKKINENATTFKNKFDNIQNQVDQLVVNGDSSPAIAQALADTPYSTLREKFESTDAELAHEAKKTPWVSSEQYASVQEALDDPEHKRVIVPSGKSLSGLTVPGGKILESNGNGETTNLSMFGIHHLEVNALDFKSGIAAFSEHVNSDASPHSTNQGAVSRFNIHNIKNYPTNGALIQVSSDFDVTSLGDRYYPTAAADPNSTPYGLVIASGKYLEHRTNAKCASGFAFEAASTVYGEGTIVSAKGAILTAQVAENFGGGIIGETGSGNLDTAMGSTSSAQVLGNKSIGSIRKLAIGAQNNVYNQGQGVFPLGHSVRAEILNTGKGKITTATNFTTYNTIGPLGWVANTSYKVGDIRRPVTDNGKAYECTVAGKSGATEPTWSTTIGATFTDGTVTWKVIDLSTAGVDSLFGVNITDTKPTGGSKIGNLYGFLLEQQTGGQKNISAYSKGDFHLAQGKRLILDGGIGTVSDATPKGQASAVYGEGGYVYFDSYYGEKVGFGFANPSYKGLGTSKSTPTSGTASAKQGLITFDDTYLYIWTSNAVVKRIPLNSF